MSDYSGKVCTTNMSDAMFFDLS